MEPPTAAETVPAAVVIAAVQMIKQTSPPKGKFHKNLLTTSKIMV